MKQSKTMLLIFPALMLLFASCHKDTIKPNKEATEYFPNTVGNYWEYEVYDSSQIRDHPNFPRQYNVKIRITGITKLVDNKDATVWNYEYPWGNEINYYRIENDTIKVYDTVRAGGVAYIPFPNIVFIQPFFNGQEWKSNALWTDSFYVKKDTIEPFKNVFQIRRKYIGQQTYYHTIYWFSPQVGFVKIYRDEINMGIRTSEIWTLKSYQLK
ncbi:MAG: hypothetical protein EO766_09015 [Hydrotalea sp. AMD]|uniref:hypothetical protein n=1 Tax=Hydrotalea sp. AMD TaxID=2501297 RepID=UPI000943B511|nr:hypothetical protein [Hydrotalea sp. AMD]RWZ88123.1 MAG: hypothetical protein EO766_09015 [Hydrotalea sp. AMD]